MAIDLDKLSSGMEEALERARLLAEQRQQAQITPLHMLYVLLDADSALSSTLERAGMATGALLENLTAKLNKLEREQKLEPGKRPIASRSLRDLIEKAFLKMEARGAEMAEPVDFLLAAIEFSDPALKQELQGAGLTEVTVAKAAEVRAAAGETLGEKKASSGPKASGKVLERFGRDLTAA